MERKIFSSYFDDGLWDIYGGLIFLGFGLSMLTGLGFLIAVFAGVAISLLLLRRQILLPRLGYVKFSAERQAKTKKQKLAAMIIGTITMILGIVFMVLFTTGAAPDWLADWMEDNFLVAFGGFLALAVAVGAYLVGVWRYFIYAGIVFIAFIIASILRPQDLEGVVITAASGLVLLSGIVILVRFLRRYPAGKEDNALK
jgi:hypothetical protein